MARLRKNTMGIPSGKIGGAVYKTRKGVPYIATEPIFNKPRESPLVIGSNNKFRFFAKLTPQLQSDPRIRSIWEASKVKGDTARHKIMSLNHSLIDSTGDLTNFKLVPFEELFPAELANTVFGNNRITLTFAPFNLPHESSAYPSISAHGVVRFYGLKTENHTRSYLIEKISSPPVPYIKGEPHAFSIEWNASAMASYNARQFCLTLLLENIDGVAAACSENVMV